MHAILSSFYSVLLGIACFAYAQNDALAYQIDEQLTAQGEWKKLGEIITRQQRSLCPLINTQNLYRKFIGVTTQGYFVMQVFYADSNKKHSDPLVMMFPDSLAPDLTLSLSPDNDPIDGPVIIWYENEQKCLEAHYTHGLRQGLRTLWFESGQKNTEEHYQDGQLQGRQTERAKKG